MLQWGRAEFSAEVQTESDIMATMKLLQWGRAEFSAEVAASTAASTLWSKLQWGRAEFSAEVRSIRIYDGLSMSFNGAALNSARK